MGARTKQFADLSNTLPAQSDPNFIMASAHLTVKYHGLRLSKCRYEDPIDPFPLMRLLFSCSFVSYNKEIEEVVDLDLHGFS